MISPDNPYTRMQRAFYEAEARKWSPENRDPVVGAWDWHNAWDDYELLFDGLDTADMVALEFGCGPGRNLIRFRDRFRRIDGTDIDPTNLVNAAKLCGDVNPPNLWACNGVDLSGLASETYDVVFSTICLQHIPVHDIRLQLFGEFFRVLKPGGYFTAQMGYGDRNDPRGVPYHANCWDADITNGGKDVLVTNSSQLAGDLYGCGFVNFEAKVRPTGPNDWHANWIFFRARKPG